MSKPMVAIVGRQNVGKSTLLNRVVGKPLAIVEDLPGTTRDRLFANVSWGGVEFVLVDTGGLEMESRSTISQRVQAQVGTAIAEADVILFLADVQDGVVPLDLQIAGRLRKTNKPIVLAVNKADNLKLENQAVDFYQLGLGEPVPISAYHGKGTAELLDKIIALLPPPSEDEVKPEVMKIAIVGRPGVGKSMLLNVMVGRERVIVGDIPGTTRDAIDTLVDFDGRSVLLIDTAGIRRRGRVEVGVEKYSVIRALRAIDRADVVLLVMDAGETVTAQDMHVAGYIEQAVKGVVVIVNKWDLVEPKSKAEWTDYVRGEMKFLDYAPILFTSALTGEGVDKLLPQAYEAFQERQRKIETAELDDVVRGAVMAHVIPRRGKKVLKLFRVAQTATNPPVFTFSVNDAKLIHFSYKRYLENKLRQAFGFNGTPIRLVFKVRGGR